MEKEPFTAEEKQTLCRLLKRVRMNGGYWPSEACMRAAHGAISAWAPELVITRTGKTTEILLSRYDGGVEKFKGMWHIPGGYASINDGTLEAACSRIAKRELGVDVTYVYTYGQPHFWTPREHPYGRPLSLYVIVYPSEEIAETRTRKFFVYNRLPKNLVGVHRCFIGGYFYDPRHFVRLLRRTEKGVRNARRRAGMSDLP